MGPRVTGVSLSPNMGTGVPAVPSIRCDLATDRVSSSRTIATRLRLRPHPHSPFEEPAEDALGGRPCAYDGPEHEPALKLGMVGRPAPEALVRRVRGIKELANDAACSVSTEWRVRLRWWGSEETPGRRVKSSAE